MSTNFEKLNLGNVTDRRRLFMVGTKREEMEDLKNSLFCHPLRRFDKTDKNKNGVIDADELLSRIKTEKIENIIRGAVEALATAVCCHFAVNYFKQMKAPSGFMAAVLGCLSAEASCNNFAILPEINKDIKALEEYIKLEKTEETAA